MVKMPIMVNKLKTNYTAFLTLLEEKLGMPLLQIALDAPIFERLH